MQLVGQERDKLKRDSEAREGHHQRVLEEREAEWSAQVRHAQHQVEQLQKELRMCEAECLRQEERARRAETEKQRHGPVGESGRREDERGDESSDSSCCDPDAGHCGNVADPGLQEQVQRLQAALEECQEQKQQLVEDHHRKLVELFASIKRLEEDRSRTREHADHAVQELQEELVSQQKSFLRRLAEQERDLLRHPRQQRTWARAQGSQEDSTADGLGEGPSMEQVESREEKVGRVTADPTGASLDVAESSQSAEEEQHHPLPKSQYATSSSTASRQQLAHAVRHAIHTQMDVS